MFQIVMPKAGQSMEDGTIVRWRKVEGQPVAVGEVLLEVETDKATVEVESAHAGVLRKTLVPEGATVKVLTPIALVGEANEPLPSDAALPAVANVAPPSAAVNAASAPATAIAPLPAGVVPIVMPKVGQSMEEGTIVKWRVAPGDPVAVSQIIMEVETDKAIVEVEATDAGRLARILHSDGATVPVLTPVALLAADDADADAYAAALQAGLSAALATDGPPHAAASVVQTSPVADATSRVSASPAARKLAAERGVDLSQLPAGRGPGGRILSTDVPAAATPRLPPVPGEIRTKLSPMRRAIATNLQRSKQTVPHFYIRTTVNACPLIAAHRVRKADFGCTRNDLVLHAVAHTVRELPAFRSRVDGDEIVELPEVNIGMAVALDHGLVVPVVVNADKLSLPELTAEARRVVEAARAGKLIGMGRGVFSISNMGMLGVEEFSAIINPPEAAILAIGAIHESPVVRDGQLAVGKVMTMTLSSDHRVIDGVMAAKFMASLKDRLEKLA